MLLIGAATVLALAGCTADHTSDSGASAPLQRPPVAPGEDSAGETGTDEDPQSTFALDVDTASYGYARRLIQDGRLPDRSEIRAEEFVNSFAQDYREPSGDGFAVYVDGARPPSFHEAGSEVRLMRVGLQTRREDTETRKDAALTFVIDVSGSMSERGRLDLVQDALHTLVDELRPTDSVAIVAFSGEARVVREMTRVSDAGSLHDAIDSLHTESSTNLEGGLVLGYRVARDGFRSGASNRVIILSDGLANVGNTDAAPILSQVREEAAKEIALLGVGVGSEYGDSLMEQLADRGDGFVVYVSERAQAREVFVKQLPASLAVRALDAKAQVTFDSEAVESYRLIGYENRALADQDFRDDRVDGGEIGPGHSVTALYAVRLAEGASDGDQVARVRVRWLDPADREPSEVSESVRVADLGGAFEGAAPRLQVCYAAGFFAETLRGGREASYDDLARVADRAADSTEDPKVRELAELIDRASRLD
ncbi:hypothetical protein Prum_042480 [Phytohabitans rumicis]|uniref:VWFA domain-containing protein n=1 Tax=Phytohabitans rumicis TaxID=1076125 RepID=A0A6V8L928_9ACTN|nr:hypothetical protein Prum_042480 [Phytohabitans rumicis]